MRNLRFKAILIFAFCIFNFMGCASLDKIVKGVRGVSTKVLEDGRKDAIKKTCNYNSNTCYEMVEKRLRQIGAYIYAKDTKKEMIAVYLSEKDTTPVGVFFREIDANNTQIEVSSPSVHGKEFIAKEVFSIFNEQPDPEEEKGKLDVKKEMSNK